MMDKTNDSIDVRHAKIDFNWLTLKYEPVRTNYKTFKEYADALAIYTRIRDVLYKNKFG